MKYISNMKQLLHIEEVTNSSGVTSHDYNQVAMQSLVSSKKNLLRDEIKVFASDFKLFKMS